MNIEEKIVSYIKNECDNVINTINYNGIIDTTNNGPYEDNETPVRACSHWIKIASFLYQKYKEQKYIECIKKLSEYIVKNLIVVDNNIYTFNSRNKKNKDHINGTIGNAWIIEGLVESSRILKNDMYYDIAKKVFLSFPFNPMIGLWNRYEIDGKLLGYDETFNHQLWLAAAGAQIINYKYDKDIDYQIKVFLDKLCNRSLFRIHKNGLIKHFSFVYVTPKSYLSFIKNHILVDYKKNKSLVYKEEGYHYFALYGFALLKEVYPNSKIFKTKKMLKALDYALDSNNYIKLMSQSTILDGTGLAAKIGIKYCCNIYSYVYNSPAYELPYIIKTFVSENYNEDMLDRLWKIQCECMYDHDGRYSSDIIDVNILKARIYELIPVLTDRK